jgi:4-aminobutyrate aminotransferase/(S)-3-amino-2-methylpropionate transaminase
MCAGFGVLSLGHNSDIQKEVFRASVEEDLVTHGMGDVYPSEDKVELLSCIGHILPKYLAKGSLALSGGQAVEIAVKTAQLATKKRGFISFEGSYHGLDLGILALTSREDFKAPFQPWLADHYVKELPFACHLDLVEAAIKRQNTPGGHGCAAVIVEPIQGRAGIRIPPSGWLEGLSAICQEQGVLLIFDEIFSGLGRCGQMTFADRVACDILCLGKALGGGLPLSACFARQEVMDAWPLNHGEAIHTGTFFGHPLSCRLGRANLAEIVKGGWISRAEAFGQEMLADLKVDIGSHPRVKDIRGMGMMIGIELNEAGLGAVWMDKLRVAGVIALASGMQGQGISLTPALNLSSSDWTDVRGLIKSTLSMV